MPALLINTSSLPNCLVVAPTTPAQLSSLVTSSSSNRAEAPMASATCRPSCSSTSATTTLAPSRANIRAVAAPMPDAAPEMMATFQRHNSIIGCGATTPQDYPETTGFGGQTEREWVTSAAAPVHSRGPIHAHLHHWQ